MQTKNGMGLQPALALVRHNHDDLNEITKLLSALVYCLKFIDSAAPLPLYAQPVHIHLNFPLCAQPVYIHLPLYDGLVCFNRSRVVNHGAMVFSSAGSVDHAAHDVGQGDVAKRSAVNHL
eukprot:scaffold24013_cov22-Tisochrysis_lutea.AAC.1